MAEQSAAEIISHHMTNLSVGEGFWSLHIDTLFFSILLGGLFCWWMRKMGQRALQHLENNEPPSFAVNVAEMIFDFVDGVVKDFFGTSRADIGSLAFTIFCWVLLWNVMDMVPVDFLPRRCCPVRHPSPENRPIDRCQRHLCAFHHRRRSDLHLPLQKSRLLWFRQSAGRASL